MKDSALNDYVAGIAAGVATVITGHPFDTVKVRLQTQTTCSNLYKYKNAFHCASDTIRTEGIRGLYKGATSSFIGVSVESCLLFGAYSQIKSYLQGEEKTNLNIFSISASAAIAGAGISFVLCPTELIKCRLQVQRYPKAHPLHPLSPSPSSFSSSSHSSSSPRSPLPASIDFSKKTNFFGPLDVVKKIYACEGFSGFYRGFLPTLLRESFGNVIFFCVYELTRHHAHRYFQLESDDPKVNNSQVKRKENDKDSNDKDKDKDKEGGHEKEIADVEKGNMDRKDWTDLENSNSNSNSNSNLKKKTLQYCTSLVTGGVAGVAFWITVFPFDIIKTRMQTSTNSNLKFVATLCLLYKENGMKSFYGGLSPTVMRAFPANAAAIFTWELFSNLLQQRDTAVAIAIALDSSEHG